MRRKYRTLLVACKRAGYEDLRELSRRLGKRGEYYTGNAVQFYLDARRRGEAIIDLIENHGWSQGDVARLLDLPGRRVHALYHAAKHRAV